MKISVEVAKHIKRIQASNEAKRTVMQKYRAIRKLKEIHENKLISGDDWRSTYRLPELFGITERKKSEVLEYLPDMVINTDFLDPYNMAVPAQAVLKYFDELSNYKDVLVQCKEAAVDYGTGIEFNGVANIRRNITPANSSDLFLKKSPKETQVYFGLAPSCIDIRDAFPDPAATMDHDPSGEKGMNWFYRRRIFTKAQFYQDFGNNPYFDISGVEPIAWSSIERDGIDRWFTKREINEKTNANDIEDSANYIVVFEGWDVIADEHVFIANNKLIYEGAIPYTHKQIPVVFHYNYKSDDSIWGISEAEINAPFILIKEVLVNLMIDNAKLTQQPVIAVSGDVQFNPDENELEPGALFMLQGLNGGKISDAITPLTFGSSVEPANAVKNILEDIQIQVTGDDSRSLFVSPNELATQTLTKREALKKRIRKNLMINVIRAARTSVYQRFNNICQFLAKPYQDMYGNWRHHVIYVDGYKIDQRTKEDIPDFTPIAGYKGAFELNDKILNPQKVRFSFVEKTDDSVKREVEMQGLQWWMQTIFSLAQVQPQLIQNIDLELLAKQAGERFSWLDVEAIFNPAIRTIDGMDEMTFYINQIQFGIQPNIPTDGNNLKRLARFARFKKSKEYKLLKKEAQMLFARTVADIVIKIRKETSGKYTDYIRLKRLGASGQVGEQGGVRRSSEVSGSTVPDNSEPATNATEGTQQL